MHYYAMLLHRQISRNLSQTLQDCTRLFSKVFTNPSHSRLQSAFRKVRSLGSLLMREIVKTSKESVEDLMCMVPAS
jgi:hypothetical protein